MKFESQNIKCNTFQDSEAIIKKTEPKMKEASSIKERKYCAQDILLEAGGLLSCSKRNPKNPDCLSCRFICHKYIQEYKHLAKDKVKESVINK